MVQIGKKRKRSSVDLKSSKTMSQVKTKLLSFQASAAQPVAPTESQHAYLHETLDFLKPGNIQDANGNKLGSANYDGSTLKVPMDFLKKQTPAMYQWWSIKSKNYDVILFFKASDIALVYLFLKTLVAACTLTRKTRKNIEAAGMWFYREFFAFHKQHSEPVRQFFRKWEKSVNCFVV